METLDATQDLARFVPSEIFGSILSATPLNIGMSGARVFAIETESCKHVLRVPSEEEDTACYLDILRAASENEIAPKLEYVDPESCATVSQAIYGEPFGRAFSNPETRGTATQSIISLLTTLHRLPTDRAEIADPIGRARAISKEQSPREGFPAWAASLDHAIDDAERLLARDPRAVLSHNDVNPANILWDGKRAWLVDWYVAAMNHPFYDLATFCTFFDLPMEACASLLAMQEGNTPTAEDLELFESLRRLIALFCAATVLKLIPDLTALPSYTLASAPTLMETYRTLSTGTINPQSPEFQHTMAIALLKQAMNG